MIPILIQARMGSKRLPGKVLMDIKGKPMLSYLIERLQLCKIAGPVFLLVPAHDAEFFSRFPVEIVHYAGDENDVYARFHYALRTKWKKSGQIDINPLSGVKSFIRVCADSPLLDPAIVDTCATFLKHSRDYPIVTNAKFRTYPQGQCVEGMDVYGFNNFFRLTGIPMSDDDKEHVMPYFYRHFAPQVLNFVNEDDKDYSDKRLVVDTQHDFDRISQAIYRMTDDHRTYGWKACLELMS
jgi:spore coat polysaccharide biosynthesis protein SpsF